MAETPRSSFIPKQSTTAIPAKMQRRRTFSVFNFLATVLLVASLMSAAGVYFYKGVTETRLNEAREALRVESEKFGTDRLNEIRDFNRQLMAVRYLLDHHVAPSKIFDALELNTMESVQFTDFVFEYDPAIDDILLSIVGGTEEFKSVALQALKFDEQALVKDAMFTKLGSTEVSNEASTQGGSGSSQHEVSFTVSGKVPTELLVYEGNGVDAVMDSTMGTQETTLPADGTDMGSGSNPI